MPLEEKPCRNQDEKDLMILAAKTGRKFWEIAGTWLQIERAEYRLSNSYRKADDLVKALEHAQTCIEICEANRAGPLEFFFGYEALALSEQARSNTIGFEKALTQVKSNFEKLSEDDKSWCKPTLDMLLNPY